MDEQCRSSGQRVVRVFYLRKNWSYLVEPAAGGQRKLTIFAPDNGVHETPLDATETPPDNLRRQ